MRFLPQHELNRLEEWHYELSPTTVRSQSPGATCWKLVLPQNELNHLENSSTVLMFCHSTNLIAWRMIMVYHWAKSADQRFVISLRGAHVFLIGAHLRCYFLLLFFSANGISKWQHIKLATCQTFKTWIRLLSWPVTAGRNLIN